MIIQNMLGWINHQFIKEKLEKDVVCMTFFLLTNSRQISYEELSFENMKSKLGMIAIFEPAWGGI